MLDVRRREFLTLLSGAVVDELHATEKQQDRNAS